LISELFLHACNAHSSYKAAISPSAATLLPAAAVLSGYTAVQQSSPLIPRFLTRYPFCQSYICP